LRDAYNAAVANAIASETAVIPEEGAIFAANAIGEDVVSIADGGANNNLSAWLSLAGNVLTLAAQGAALTGAAEIVIPVGAAVFTIDQLAFFIGYLVTGFAASADSADIKNYLTEAANTLGMTANANGSYNVTPDGNSTYAFNPSTAVGTFSNEGITEDGSTTDYTFNADGSQSAVVLNSSGQETESIQTNADGSSTTSFFNPTTGALTQQTAMNSSGTSIGSMQANYQYPGGPLIGYTVSGTGNSLVASNLVIQMADADSQLTLAGSGDEVSGGTVTFESSDASITAAYTNLVMEGTGDQVLADGSGSTVTLGAGVGVTVDGLNSASGATLYSGVGNAVTV